MMAYNWLPVFHERIINSQLLGASASVIAIVPRLQPEFSRKNNIKISLAEENSH